jgi:hypothetical protein
MGLGSVLKGIAGVGSIAAAPFTGGTSLSWLPAALSGASAVGGALSNTKGARTSTYMPTIAPEYKSLADLLRGRVEERMRKQFDASGMEASGISNINDVFRNVKTASDNNLTSRGLATSPVAGAVDTNLETARGGNIAEFLNSIPQIQRQYENDDLSNALNVLNLGRGTETVAPGSAVGSAFTSGVGSMARLLGMMHGQGTFGQKNQGSIYTGDVSTPPFWG